MLNQERMAHLSRLARLAPDDETLQRFATQCDDILSYMNVLSEVDTNDVEPLYSPVRHQNALRPDIAVKRQQRADVLANAPETDGQFFVVPRIV